MKNTLSLITIIVLSLITGTQISRAANNSASTDLRQSAPKLEISAQDSADALRNLVAVSPETPRGPREILADYESEMANITRRMTGELGAISQAVADRQLTRDQGEHLARERYQVAMMQFQLLSTWHAILEQEVARAAAAQPNLSPAAQALVVPLPFSSLQLNPTLARHLELTQQQVEAIQELMEQERPGVSPLMAELDVTRQELVRETRSVHPNQERVRALALTQARLLSTLVAENSRLQAKIGALLNAEQRRKLEALLQANEAAVPVGD